MVTFHDARPSITTPVSSAVYACTPVSHNGSSDLKQKTFTFLGLTRSAKMQYNTIYQKSLLYVVGHHYDEVRVWVFDLTEDDGQEHLFTYKIITSQTDRTIPVTD